MLERGPHDNLGAQDIVKAHITKWLGVSVVIDSRFPAVSPWTADRVPVEGTYPRLESMLPDAGYVPTNARLYRLNLNYICRSNDPSESENGKI